MSGSVGTNSGRRSGSIGTAASGPTVSASNPAIDTNPSGGVGTQWANSSTGDFYVCTTATAGENVWTNVDAGQSSIAPYAFQGSNYGYTHGGESSGPSDLNIISKFSVTSDGDSSDVGDLTASLAYVAGCSSPLNGYAAGGQADTSIINKYSFSSDGNATDTGNLAVANTSAGAFSSETLGYLCGGYSGGYLNTIQSIPYASDGDGADVADMTESKLQMSGATDTTNGYTMCGSSGSPMYSTVEKYVYSSGSNSTDIGDMTRGQYVMGGSSSTTHGYSAGGDLGGSSITDTIEKFNFSGTFSVTDVGNLSGSKRGCAGQSSTTHGYVTGGGLSSASGTGINVQDKYAFASDGDASDIGDLTSGSIYCAGTQY